MKSMRTLAALALAATTFAGAVASAQYYRDRDGYYRRGGHHHHNRSGYNEGVRDGVLASSAGYATSRLVDKRTVYLAADEDAAMFLAQGGEPTAILNEAMTIEENFLREHKYEEVNYFNAEDLAYMVMGRADQLR